MKTSALLDRLASHTSITQRILRQSKNKTLEVTRNKENENFENTGKDLLSQKSKLKQESVAHAIYCYQYVVSPCFNCKIYWALWPTLCYTIYEIHPSMLEETSTEYKAPTQEPDLPLTKRSPSASLWRGLSLPIIAGQVVLRILKGKIHWRNTLQQLERIGPKSLGVCLLTSTLVGMAFTIQFVREFTRLGLNRSIGGVLALAFSRELSPVITSIVVAGRMGSAFAAELGTMQVSEQTNTLRVLGTDPIDYLITPRVIASCLALPVLTLLCFTVGMASSALLSDAVYGISINIIMDSAHRTLRQWDIVSAMIKSQVFGAIISVISCSWGVTTTGGAKGVGESTTSAVVMSLVGIFIADFVLSSFFFQGAGDSLKNCV